MKIIITDQAHFGLCVCDKYQFQLQNSNYASVAHSALDHIKMWSDAIIPDKVFYKFWIVYQTEREKILQKWALICHS